MQGAPPMGAPRQADHRFPSRLHLESNAELESAIVLEPGVILLQAVVIDLLEEDSLGVEQIAALNVEFQIVIDPETQRSIKEARSILPDRQRYAAIERRDEVF
jgi:hypothetical protein